MVCCCSSCYVLFFDHWFVVLSLLLHCVMLCFDTLKDLPVWSPRHVFNVSKRPVCAEEPTEDGTLLLALHSPRRAAGRCLSLTLSVTIWNDLEVPGCLQLGENFAHKLTG